MIRVDKERVDIQPETEIFAAACAIELPESAEGLTKGTWTTGTGTGSDVDDQ